MPVANAILQSRTTYQGHFIEVDFRSDDGTTSTLEIAYSQIQFMMRALWNAMAEAEAAQRRAAGERVVPVVAPYTMTDIRFSRSLKDDILADFRTEQGPVQIGMTVHQARVTIERLETQLARIADRPSLRS